MQYVQVVESDSDDPIELPTEDDGTLLVSTLAGQFVGACGLKYRVPETGKQRGVRLAGDRLHPPEGGRWGVFLYFTVYPKAAPAIPILNDAGSNKRKLSADDAAEIPVVKARRFENKTSTDLIVLGLPWKTTDDDMREYFTQFGEMAMCQVKRDLVTGKSKGFGFIRFNDYESQIHCLTEQHVIDGRHCDVKLPATREYSQPAPSSKVFVGRCTEDLSTDDLHEFFSKYGEVTDVYIPRPFRAFAFVTFAEPEAAAAVCGGDFVVKGASVHVSTAAPKGEPAFPRKAGMGWEDSAPTAGKQWERKPHGGGARGAFGNGRGGSGGGMGGFMGGGFSGNGSGEFDGFEGNFGGFNGSGFLGGGFNQTALNQMMMMAATQAMFAHGGFGTMGGGSGVGSGGKGDSTLAGFVRDSNSGVASSEWKPNPC